ncbi:DUF4198 domain-containing protein [candidate division KSB1 bacterium]|nr:DUF4198 domain-containing protein [candidate division KSB1 bacterium]
MKKFSIIAILCLCATVLSAHDMFLKLQSFFLKPRAQATIALYNGTFDKSENVISRDRMQDVSVAGPNSERVHPDTSQWHDAGNTSMLDLKTSDAGTYVVGVSTKPKVIALSAKDFNEYLQHDGVLDVYEARRKSNALEKDARELYSKHIKAVVQVGDKRSDGFKARLGYPIEIVPLQNPYTLKEGEVLEVLVLSHGKPLANELVYANFAGHHEHAKTSDGEERHEEAVTTRTDANGVAKIKLEEHGHWYIRLIRMVPSNQKDVDYESNWATLTFEIK